MVRSLLWSSLRLALPAALAWASIADAGDWEQVGRAGEWKNTTAVGLNGALWSIERDGTIYRTN